MNSGKQLDGKVAAGKFLQEKALIMSSIGAVVSVRCLNGIPYKDNGVAKHSVRCKKKVTRRSFKSRHMSKQPATLVLKCSEDLF